MAMMERNAAKKKHSSPLRIYCVQGVRLTLMLTLSTVCRPLAVLGLFKFIFTLVLSDTMLYNAYFSFMLLLNVMCFYL